LIFIDWIIPTWCNVYPATHRSEPHLAAGGRGSRLDFRYGFAVSFNNDLFAGLNCPNQFGQLILSFRNAHMHDTRMVATENSHCKQLSSSGPYDNEGPLLTRQTSVRAHAKLNLSLRVLHRRPDHFHELRTIFQTISLADQLDIALTPSRTTEIKIENSSIPDNLIERAARLALDEMRLTARIEFHLKKKIPMGAGLGGGSSDAAAVLLSLPPLAGGIIPMDRLLALGATLGSDVPFFLYGGTALGLGKGEELYPLPDIRPREGVLITSNIHVSTPEAYRDLSAGLAPPAPKLACFQSGAWSTEGFEAVNDFEAPVFQRHPELQATKDRLRLMGAEPALMTGSGSAIFALFNQKETLSDVVQSWGEQGLIRFRLVSGANYRRDWLRRLQPHIKGEIWPPRSRYVR
jgi:4-diphosphocytidyl-2-C-methyl-D-erythritol kinase